VRVTIVGAGLMGAQIGCEYALGGHEVRVHSRDLARAQQRVADGFAVLEAHGLSTADDVRAAAGRVRPAARPGEAARDADLLVESLPEDVELKASVLTEALAGARQPVVATNTSSLSITAIGEAIGAPERTLGTHYLNPPLLMPTVEVIAGERTAPETVTLVQKTLLALGKLPVLVRRDVPGFVWNRLQFALLREALASGTRHLAARWRSETPQIKRALVWLLSAVPEIRVVYHDLIDATLPDEHRAEWEAELVGRSNGATLESWVYSG